MATSVKNSVKMEALVKNYIKKFKVKHLVLYSKLLLKENIYLRISKEGYGNPHVNWVGNLQYIKVFDTSKESTYSISTSASSINEGNLLTTTVSTTNLDPETTLYYSLSGTGITSSDFSDGALSGSGNISSDGTFSFSHTIIYINRKIFTYRSQFNFTFT